MGAKVEFPDKKKKGLSPNLIDVRAETGAAHEERMAELRKSMLAAQKKQLAWRRNR